jgi:hypothetical protein
VTPPTLLVHSLRGCRTFSGDRLRRRSDVAEAEGGRLGKGSAADLLSNWRAAERDRVAAEETASVATLAAAAAAEAMKAATETADAARLSLEASQRAENAARRTSEAADIAARTAKREQADADQAVVRSRKAEEVAQARFLDGQRQGFPKDGA